MAFKIHLTVSLLALTFVAIQGQTNKPTNPPTDPPGNNQNNVPGAGATNKPTNPPTDPPGNNQNNVPGAGVTNKPTNPPSDQPGVTNRPTNPPNAGFPRFPTAAPTPPAPTRRPITPTPPSPAPGGAPGVVNNVDSCGCGPPVTINQYCGSCEGKVNIISRDFVNSPDGPDGPDYPDSPRVKSNQILGCDCADLTRRLKTLENDMLVLKSQVQELMVLSSNRIVSTDANKDCYDMYYRDGVKENGIYEAMPDGLSGFPVYCMFDQTKGGGVKDKWTVIANRVNGKTDFQRNWSEYKTGFGTIGENSNFWIGLEKMRKITSQRQYTMRIDLTDGDDEVRYAQYSSFLVGPEEDGYPLFYEGYSGSAGDSLGDYHRNMKFTTIDVDNDLAPNENCAYRHGGGFWYNDCDHANFNGPYSSSNLVLNDQNVDYGIEWDEWKQLYSFSRVIVRIKPTFDDAL